MGLPADSATRIAMNGEPLWTRTDFILADVVDALSAVQWITANKDVEKRSNRTPYPKPYPRPGLEVKRTVTAADLLAHRERTRRT